MGQQHSNSQYARNSSSQTPMKISVLPASHGALQGDDALREIYLAAFETRALNR